MVKKVTKSGIIQAFLNNYSRRYYLRELAEILEKPHQTIKPYIIEMVKENILLEIKRRKITEYALNFKNKNIYDYLIIAEKEKMLERLNQDIYLKTLFEKLALYFEKDTFIIFGSAVENIKKGSDIDLIDIGKQNIKIALDDFEDIYNKKIHLIKVDNLKNITLSLIKEIYKKHLIFNNAEKIIRYFGGLYEKNKLV